jgi:hypothetical protein
MIIYNVTVNIDVEVKDEWMNWMKTKHIPDVMNTGKFIDCRFSRILAEEQGGEAYSIQYLCKSQADFEAYQRDYAEALQEEHTVKYSGKFGAFRTLMEVVDHFTYEG